MGQAQKPSRKTRPNVPIQGNRGKMVDGLQCLARKLLEALHGEGVPGIMGDLQY